METKKIGTLFNVVNMIEKTQPDHPVINNLKWLTDNAEFALQYMGYDCYIVKGLTHAFLGTLFGVSPVSAIICIGEMYAEQIKDIEKFAMEFAIPLTHEIGHFHDINFLRSMMDPVNQIANNMNIQEYLIEKANIEFEYFADLFSASLCGFRPAITFWENTLGLMERGENGFDKNPPQVLEQAINVLKDRINRLKETSYKLKDSYF